MTVLVVAAHPDDETLGAGGSIARWTAEGREVAWLVLGEGSTSRSAGDDPAAAAAAERQRSDCRAAAEVLGVTDVSFAGLPDQRFDRLDLVDVVALVQAEVDRVQPTVVVSHHRGDLNRDHRITAEAVLVATRPVGSTSVRTVLAFEVLSSTEWAFDPSTAFNPNLFVDVTAHLEAKVAALASYSGEVRELPHPRSEEAVRALARLRGSTTGVEAAEAFQIVRSRY